MQWTLIFSTNLGLVVFKFKIFFDGLSGLKFHSFLDRLDTFLQALAKKHTKNYTVKLTGARSGLKCSTIPLLSFDLNALTYFNFHFIASSLEGINKRRDVHEIMNRVHCL